MEKRLVLHSSLNDEVEGEESMEAPIPVEYQGQRILTTPQLADSYESDTQLIVNNFNRNKDHYQVGKHYFPLEGEEKRLFIDQHQIDLGSKNAKTLYLWTEKGAWLHAKSLNTDKAWEAYEMLVDDYYSAKQAPKLPQNYIEALEALLSSEKEKQILLPKAESYDTFMDAKNNQTMNVVAKALGIGRNKLFEFLRTKKVLMSTNIPYQEHIDSGRFVVKEKPISMGENTINKPQTFVTPKGVTYIEKLLKEAG